MTDYNDLAYSLAGRRRTSPFDRRRQMAQGFMQQSLDTSPVQHPLQGVSRMAQALVGVLMSNKADSDEKEATEKQQSALATAMSEPDPQKRIQMLSATNPELGARLSGQLAVEQAKIDRQTAGLQTGGGQLAAGYGMTPPAGAQGQQTAAPGPGGSAPPGFANNVGNIRVSNANWQDRGQPHNGFETFSAPEAGARAMYQNLQTYAQRNPQMTVAQAIATWAPPSENNTQAYVARIASAGIDPNMPLAGVLRDPQVAGKLMMTMGVHEKGGLPPGFTPQTFIAAAGGQPQQVAQGGNPQAATGMPPAPSPQGLQGPAVVAPPAIPDIRRPTQPSPQILAQAEALLKSGQFGRDIATAGPAARAWVDQQMEREYQDAKSRADKQYEQQFEGYKNERGAPQKTFENAGKLRDDFGKEPVVKAYRVVVPMLESAKDAATRPTRAADINLVYAFAKLMDPDSVVRESETGMVVQSATIGDRLQGLLGQLNGNPMLQPETRTRLIAELQSRFNSLATSYQEIEGAYGSIADAGGIKREHVILPIRKPGQGPQIESPTAAKSGGGNQPGGLPKLGANGEGYDELKPGQQYVAPDGSTRTKGGG